ncbi:MAG TPA: ASKHA domain-containing protein [Clostridia bacterium]|nr:ASKHA domain-containing protein [Clostridia bacterium]
MARIKFANENKEITAESAITIAQAARLAGVVTDTPCGGMGICGKCKVRITRPDGKERIVLACQTTVKDDIIVYTQGNNDDNKLNVLTDGLKHNTKPDSRITKRYDESEDKTYVYADGIELCAEAHDTSRMIYGIAIDIGTTTLVVSLVDLITGAMLDTASALNPQARYAQDIISRISYASDAQGLETLHTAVINKINDLTSQIAARNQIDPSNIYETVFCGNTTVLHIAAKVNPKTLGFYPFEPALATPAYLPARAINLKISPIASVYLPPCISSYIGADITAGILSAQLHKSEGRILFVDIGTNGEMVFSDHGRMLAASTAAGPAFEGMTIEFGMRAEPGAIDYFKIDDAGNQTIRVIGNQKAIGICGSGLIDIAGELVRHKIVDANGKFDSAKAGDRLIAPNGKPAYRLTPDIYLTQKDIRQVQLAKAAIRAGIELLLHSAKLSAESIDAVLIAGAFGYHLREESLINIGLLPGTVRGKVRFIGNTSISGGRAFLINKACRAEMEQQVKDVTVLELSARPDFQDVFVDQLAF